MTALSVLTPGSVSICSANSQGGSVGRTDDTACANSVVLEVSACCDAGSSGEIFLESTMLILDSFSTLSATVVSLLGAEVDCITFLSGPALLLFTPPLEMLSSLAAVDEFSDLVAEAGNQRSTTVSAPSVCRPV